MRLLWGIVMDPVTTISTHPIRDKDSESIGPDLTVPTYIELLQGDDVSPHLPELTRASTSTIFLYSELLKDQEDLLKDYDEFFCQPSEIKHS